MTSPYNIGRSGGQVEAYTPYRPQHPNIRKVLQDPYVRRTLPVLPDQTIGSASGRPGGDRDTLSPTYGSRLHSTNRQTSKTQDSNNYKTSKTLECSSLSQSHLIRQYSLPQETLGGTETPKHHKADQNTLLPEDQQDPGCGGLLQHPQEQTRRSDPEGLQVAETPSHQLIHTQDTLSTNIQTSNTATPARHSGVAVSSNIS